MGYKNENPLVYLHVCSGSSRRVRKPTELITTGHDSLSADDWTAQVSPAATNGAARESGGGDRHDGHEHGQQDLNDVECD